MTDTPTAAGTDERSQDRRHRWARDEHRHSHRADRHPATHWSPTVLLIRIALFALAVGGAAWSVRWGWQTLQGS